MVRGNQQISLAGFCFYTAPINFHLGSDGADLSTPSQILDEIDFGLQGSAASSLFSLERCARHRRIIRIHSHQNRSIYRQFYV